MTTATRSVTVWIVITAVLCVAATLFLFWQPAAASDDAAGQALLPAGAVQWGFLAAALATGLSSLAAGIAVANVGSAAIGMLAEKPEMLGRALIMVGLAEGIAIYGLIISILILNRVL